jgi:hypothetical protein
MWRYIIISILAISNLYTGLLVYGKNHDIRCITNELRMEMPYRYKYYTSQALLDQYHEKYGWGECRIFDGDYMSYVCSDLPWNNTGLIEVGNYLIVED